MAHLERKKLYNQEKNSNFIYIPFTSHPGYYVKVRFSLNERNKKYEGEYQVVKEAPFRGKLNLISGNDIFNRQGERKIFAKPITDQTMLNEFLDQFFSKNIQILTSKTAQYEKKPLLNFVKADLEMIDNQANIIHAINAFAAEAAKEEAALRLAAAKVEEEEAALRLAAAKVEEEEVEEEVVIVEVEEEEVVALKQQAKTEALGLNEEKAVIDIQYESFPEPLVSSVYDTAPESNHSAQRLLSTTTDPNLASTSMFSSPAFKGTMYGISGVVVAGGVTDIVLNQVGMEAVKIANMSINLLPIEIAIPVTCAFFIIGLAVSLRPSKKESMAGFNERNSLDYSNDDNMSVNSRASSTIVTRT